MGPIWLLRAKRWAQNPPSPARIKLVFGVIALCVLLVLAEYFDLTPAWMALEPTHPRRGLGL